MSSMGGACYMTDTPRMIGQTGYSYRKSNSNSEYRPHIVRAKAQRSNYVVVKTISPLNGTRQIQSFRGTPAALSASATKRCMVLLTSGRPPQRLQVLSMRRGAGNLTASEMKLLHLACG
jgi:hypothetical protein